MPLELVAFGLHGCVLGVLAWPTSKAPFKFVYWCVCLLVLGLLGLKCDVPVIVGAPALMALDVAYAACLFRHLHFRKLDLQRRLELTAGSGARE